MAFLENDGNIILDCVLTDTGRMRLANGDFKIVKFAVGDDEINYGAYNKNHPSGSAYYGLEVEQSPVFEAFTDNSSTMVSHLLSIPDTNLLYLAILKLNEVSDGGAYAMHSSDTFLVAVNKTTEDAFLAAGVTTGLMFGENPGSGVAIRVDQGIDSSEISPTSQLINAQKENQYTIQIDNRLGLVVDDKNENQAIVSSFDDDDIASYYLTLPTDTTYVKNNGDIQTTTAQAIAGPRGTTLKFKLQASTQLNSSTYLFTTLGSENTVAGISNVKYIDSVIKVRGETTGYSIDIPVRWVRV